MNMQTKDWFETPEKTIEDQQAISKAAMYGFMQRGARKY